MTTFERRDLGGLRALVSVRLERDGVLAAFFERSGGASTGPFGALNGSFDAGDDDAAVRTNRARAAAAMGLERFCVPGLVHGTAIERVGRVRAADGFDGPAERLRHADGTTTRLAGVGLGAFSGDCAIAVLWHPFERRLTLVHAGWRGLAAGIIGRAARLYADRRDVRVAVGPAIGPCHYEVGEEVVRAVEAGSPGGAVAERRRGRWVLDLAGSVGVALDAEGIRSVDTTEVCTACEADRFYSYRRDGVTGRHLAVARLRVG